MFFLKKTKKHFGLYFLLLVLITTNMLTYFLPKYIPVFTGKSIIIDADDAVTAANIKKMIYLSEQLEQNFLWDIDEQAMWDSAIKGMFAGLDDVYSGYMTADEYTAYTESTSGSYSGIGVNITNNDDNNVQILRVFSGSPAESAGLKAGDIILSAGDRSLIGVSVDLAATYIKGEEGTTVTLTVSRDGSEFSVDVERRSIEIEYTTYEMLSDNIGYIRITEFETNTYKQFAQAVSALNDMGMQGLIIDLRQNPGGAVDETIDIADDLLGSCDIIYTLDKSENKKVYTSDASKTVNVPIVCLIDENSASASEILAIALKDNSAATIVGVTSYGKGIMQTLIPLSDGSMYKYTFCEYYGPAGTKIHELGVIPDVEVQQNADYKNVAVESIPEGSDAQLSKAIEVLKNEIGQ
jgi:carboxyl-terminal processing protease